MFVKRLYDVNIRSVVALREIGKGYTSLTTFCGLMNMTRKTFLELQTNVAPIYMKVAQDAMISAANEIRQTSGC